MNKRQQGPWVGRGVTSRSFVFQDDHRLPGWKVTGHYRSTRQGVVITDLTIEPRKAGSRRIVDSALLRTLAVGDIVEALSRDMAKHARAAGTESAAALARNDIEAAHAWLALQKADSMATAPPSRGSAAHHRAVALAYIEESLKPREPGKGRYQQLAEREDMPHRNGQPVSEHTVKGWIGAARKAGWLGPSGRGPRARATPGPKLTAWIKQQEKKP